MRCDDTTRILPAAPMVEPEAACPDDPGARVIAHRTASGRFVARPYGPQAHAAIRRPRDGR